MTQQTDPIILDIRYGEIQVFFILDTPLLHALRETDLIVGFNLGKAPKGCSAAEATRTVGKILEPFFNKPFKFFIENYLPCLVSYIRKDNDILLRANPFS